MDSHVLSSNGASNTAADTLPTIPLIIDGQEEKLSKTFPVISPYTGKPCWNVAAASSDDGRRAVDSAAKAFPLWSATKPAERRRILLRAADILEANLEENAAIMRTEMGADVGASQFFVVPGAIAMLRDYASRASTIVGSVPEMEDPERSAIVYKVPMGVILGIVPWNGPFVFAIRSAACALAGGNTTIIKSSEYSPKCYYAVGKAFLEAGLPPGCLNIVSCDRDDAPAIIEAMVAHDAVRKVNFTGSSNTGRKIASLCGKYLKPTLMELGGKNSAIVCADANLQLSVDAVLAGAYLNSGQICMSTDRILIHEKIAPAFLQALKSALVASSAASDSVPTLVNAASKSRIQEVVRDAIAAGAQLEHGDLDAGKDAPGVHLAPLLLGNVPDDNRLWQEESFASVAAYKVVKTDEEAIAIANSGGYGLSASVFSEDLRKAMAIAKQLESGAVHINSMTVHDEAVLPHGGVKNSGWGRFNADQGLDEFLVTKTVTWRH